MNHFCSPNCEKFHHVSDSKIAWFYVAIICISVFAFCLAASAHAEGIVCEGFSWSAQHKIVYTDVTASSYETWVFYGSVGSSDGTKINNATMISGSGILDTADPVLVTSYAPFVCALIHEGSDGEALVGYIESGSAQSGDGGIYNTGSWGTESFSFDPLWELRFWWPDEGMMITSTESYVRAGYSILDYTVTSWCLISLDTYSNGRVDRRSLPGYGPVEDGIYDYALTLVTGTAFSVTSSMFLYADTAQNGTCQSSNLTIKTGDMVSWFYEVGVPLRTCSWSDIRCLVTPEVGFSGRMTQFYGRWRTTPPMSLWYTAYDQLAIEMTTSVTSVVFMSMTSTTPMGREIHFADSQEAYAYGAAHIGSLDGWMAFRRYINIAFTLLFICVCIGFAAKWRII